MATSTSTPDLDTLSKWEDAFQHPVPTVRSLERQLRGSLAGNREKLRTLVGESYRDLLSTAEKIIEMSQSIQRVESHLNTTSSYCNLRLMQRKAENVKALQNKMANWEREKYEFAIELLVLQNCPLAMSRLLQDTSMYLLASKVFVLSRLLLKSLSQKASVPIVDNLRRQIKSFRSVLLRHIDRHLSASGLTDTELLGNMVAFALISSSSCADVLLHFQSVLLDAICATLDAREPDSLSLLNSFRLYNRMLADTVELFPLRLSDMLLSLKSRTLFADSTLRSLSELNLTSHLSWLPEHIRNFTPWVRHDDLQISKARSETINKSGRAIKVLLESTEHTLDSIDDIDGLVALRNEVLSLWKLNKQKLESVGSEQWEPVMEDLRKLFHNRIFSFLKKQVSSLSSLATSVKENVQVERERENTSLWSDSIVSCDIHQGGRNFKECIRDLVSGEGKAIKEFDVPYSTWLDKVVHDYLAIKYMTAEKEWDPDNIDDNDSELDGVTGSSDFDRKDSELLLKEQLTILKLEYKSFDEIILSSIQELRKGSSEGVSSVSLLRSSSYLLRILLKVRYGPPQHERQPVLKLDWFGEEPLPHIHDLIAEAVIKRPHDAFNKAYGRQKWETSLPFSSLWEGSPPLPIHPSPLVFKLLHRLTESMASAGADVWTTGATDMIKVKLANKIWAGLKPVLEELVYVEKPKEVTEEPEPKESIALEEKEGSKTATSTITHKERILQTIFDASYLDFAFQTRTVIASNAESEDAPTKVGLAREVQELIAAKNYNVKDDDRNKISRSAEEYWSRTSLLFGLLGM